MITTQNVTIYYYYIINLKICYILKDSDDGVYRAKSLGF
jgi:hypothetical protein